MTFHKLFVAFMTLCTLPVAAESEKLNKSNIAQESSYVEPSESSIIENA